MLAMTRRMAGLALVATAMAARAEPQARLYRVAGTGEPGFDGDGGPANHARLNGPAGLGFDPQGNLYIADLKNAAIRRVDAKTNIITTLAGTGRSGFSGDGGPAHLAELGNPEGVAVDTGGNVYIADSRNNRIRRINRDGLIDTIAGGGNEDPRSFDGPAQRVALKHPAGVVVDGAGTVYFNDYGHDIVGAVTPDGRFRRVAGTGEPGYAGDGGSGRDAQLNDVYGIGLDPLGALYICDSLNFVIRKLEDGRITTVVRGLSGVAHPKGTIGPTVPHGVEADGKGNIYVADTAARQLRLFTPTTESVLAGNGEPGVLIGDGTPALNAAIEIHGVRLSPQGEPVFVDFRHHAVYRLKRS